MAFYLSIKEVWRNKGRFFLFSLVIALIALLVLFTAALGEGLATANKEYLAKLDADLLAFQDDTGYSTVESQLDYIKTKRISRLPEVANAGAIGFTTVKLVLPDSVETTNISFIGIEPGKPGDPKLIEGSSLELTRSNTIVIDARVAELTRSEIGDSVTIKTSIGTEYKFYDLTVVGITSGQQYFFQPSIFASLSTWDTYRPKQGFSTATDLPVTNIVAVKLKDNKNLITSANLIADQIDGISLTDIITAYEAAPGYTAQQGTLNTIKVFTFLIGALVIGGFFQIQTLQKIPQIGMLKAIGMPNLVVAVAALTQIILVTVIGIMIGTASTYGLAMGMPSGVPVEFNGNSVIIAVISLLLIGPIGGMVSVVLAIKVEPLKALGM